MRENTTRTSRLFTITPLLGLLMIGVGCGDEQLIVGQELLVNPECSDNIDNDSDGLVDFPADPSCLSSEGTESLTAPPTAKIDLLFVVDTSRSMEEENLSVQANFDALISALETSPGGFPSLQAAVITSDIGLLGGVGNVDISECTSLGDGAEFQVPNAACTTLSEPVIRDLLLSDGTRDANFSGTWSEAYACLGPEPGGCGFEQPLQAIERALDGTNLGNNTFLRPDAKLAIVIVTDEDDCSVGSGSGLFSNDESTFGPLDSFRCSQFGLICDGQPVERVPTSYTSCEPSTDPNMLHPDETVAFLTQLKGNPDDIMVAIISGDPDGLDVVSNGFDGVKADASCESTQGSAIPGNRLAYFANQFTNSIVTSVCAPNLSGALNSAANMIVSGLPQEDPSDNGNENEDENEDETSDPGGCSSSGKDSPLPVAIFLLGLCWLRTTRKTQISN